MNSSLKSNKRNLNCNYIFHFETKYTHEIEYIYSLLNITYMYILRENACHFSKPSVICEVVKMVELQIMKYIICCLFTKLFTIIKIICGNKMPTRCNRGFYCRSYCLLNMFRAPLCPSSGSQEYYTVVAACGISCCGARNMLSKQ